MTALTYPPARAVAERIVAQFAGGGTDPEAPPDAAAIEEIISAAFWASLLREEGRAPKISLALVRPELTPHPLFFHPRVPLVADALARLAPAVERPGIHLGVWRGQTELGVWGTTRIVPTRCFVLEVVAPGLLVVKSRRSERSAKFANVVVLEGADVKFVDHHGAAALDAPPALGALGAFYSSAGAQESDNVFVQVAISMLEHRRGGSLLVVPAGTEDWRASIIQPIPYSVSPPFAGIAELLEEPDAPVGAVRAAVDALAGLTAVDGATIVSNAFDVLAFGAKIARRDGTSRVEQVLLTQPIHGAAGMTVEPSQLGGTRHLSAAQFVHDSRDSLALVASQDGRFTVFAWSPVRQMVHAHRLETLLL